MRKVEIDERGRLSLPAKIREKLSIKQGDKLIIKINSDNSIVLHKTPTKQEIFEKLVGCIQAPLEEKIRLESTKSIFKEDLR